MNTNTFWIIIGLACFGILNMSLIFHEAIHIFQSDNPKSVCLDFGQETVAHVEGKDFKANTELWAYGLEGLFILIGCGSLFYIARRETR